jgi:transposase InsO family protein
LRRYRAVLAPRDRPVGPVENGDGPRLAGPVHGHLAARAFGQVTLHSDQGSQFTSRAWHSLLHRHHLEARMSRRGNGHDNAVAESFVQRLTRERIRRKTSATREAARCDVFEHIERF